MDDSVRRYRGLCGCALAICLIAGVNAAAPREVVGPVESLRRQHLYRQAQAYCERRLADAQLTAAERATWTLELIRCHSAEALNAPPQARDAFWQAAAGTAAEFARLRPDHPRLCLVRFEAALATLACGELGRQEAEVLSDPASALAGAKAALREALKMLRQLDDELTREIARRRPPASADHLSADELRVLQHNVRRELARAFRNQALCYPADSDDRVAALTLAAEQLRRSLTQVAVPGTLTERMRLELALCQRCLGNLAEAEQLLHTLQAEASLPDVKMGVLAELARLELDRRHPQKAWDVLIQLPDADSASSSPELTFARLETALARWALAREVGDDQEARQWQRTALATVQRLENTHGPYWARRGDLLLLRSLDAAGLNRDVELSTRAADNLYRTAQIDAAIAAYAQAAAAAAANQDPEKAFRLRYKAALAEQERQHFDSASQRHQALGLEFRTHPAASRAHLLAAWNMAQAARSDRRALKRYAELLEEHLAMWPEGATANQARMWLARLRAGQEQWATGAAVYQGVTPGSRYFEEAVFGAARCWLQRADQLTGSARPRVSAPPFEQPPAGEPAPLPTAAQEELSDAARFFERLVQPDGQPLPTTWTPLLRSCVETAARLRLAAGADGLAEAESLLRAALQGQPAPEAAWSTSARSLLVLAVGAQSGRRQEALAVLLPGGETKPAREYQLLDELSATARAQPRFERGLSELQLMMFERLWPRRSALSLAQQLALQQLRVAALVRTGRRPEALALQADLAGRNPNSVEIQEAYAELLLNGEDRNSWTRALEQWRRVAQLSSLRTDSWYRAKYALCLTLLKCGEPQAAAARIRYLQAVPPGLVGTPWSAKFVELLKRCEQR